MVTFVEIQDNSVEALKESTEQNYTAVDAHEAAIGTSENSIYQERVREFRDNHERIIKEISALLKKNKRKVPKKGTVGKQFLTREKTLLANILLGNTILQAMKSMEWLEGSLSGE